MTIPAAIIGLGRIASLLEADSLREKPATHAGALHENEACRIVGGCDLREDRRIAFAKRWNVPFTTASPLRLIQEVRPELLVVATHPDSHESILRVAVAQGVPVVICEKPLAHSLRSARRMARLVSANPATRVLVNHERRYSRDYQLVREAVMQRRFGDLLSVNGTLFFGRNARHDVVFQHDGTHLVDAIHYLTGAALRVSRRSASMKSPVRSVFLSGILSPNAVPVSLEIGSGRTYLEFELELSFENGRIRVGNGLFTWETSKKSPYYEDYRSLVDLHRSRPFPSNYFIEMVNDAVRCVRDPSRLPVSSIEDAVSVMRVIRSFRART